MVSEQLEARGIRDHHVLDAMRRVPRHLFVEEALAPQSYGDYPLPIGEKQTISQPFIVAQMTAALELTGTEKVLEIGTGSGYQTAILAELAHKVYSVERIKPLYLRARRILEQLKYYNVALKLADGSLGWSDETPFDAIIVTAGAPEVPEALLRQLVEGGRMVIPVGDRFNQALIRAVKQNEWIKQEDLGACRFVPLVGNQAWKA
ncbi:MAG: protein-L-isoaspartate(D-aspartate) O-methyltransferase [Pseudomonadota bacterium]